MKDRDRSFAGKHVLLTGAASGIGRAAALELARRGARLALVDIDARGLAEIVAAVNATGASASGHVADLASAEAISPLVQAVLASLGHLDVLINNAGVAVVKPLLETTSADWEWIMGVNLWGPIRLTQALLPHLVARGQGHIVMTASLAGLVGAPGMVAYSTTKFGIVGFAEALRLELADTDVAVTVICPGFVRTNLQKATRYANAGFERFLESAPSWYGVSKERAARILVDAISKKTPLVAFGPEKLGWWIKRISPAAAFAVTRWVGKKTECTSP